MPLIAPFIEEVKLDIECKYPLFIRDNNLQSNFSDVDVMDHYATILYSDNLYENFEEYMKDYEVSQLHLFRDAFFYQSIEKSMRKNTAVKIYRTFLDMNSTKRVYFENENIAIYILDDIENGTFKKTLFQDLLMELEPILLVKYENINKITFKKSEKLFQIAREDDSNEREID